MSMIDVYGKNPDGSSKAFIDSDRPKSISVGFFTLCKSETKARNLGRLEIGETYRDWNGRTFKRVK